MLFGNKNGLSISTMYLQHFLSGHGKELYFGSNSLVADKLKMTSYYQEGLKELYKKIITK